MKDHQVELRTRDGDRLVRHVDAAEAARLEEEPFRKGSNIAVVSVQTSRKGKRS